MKFEVILKYFTCFMLAVIALGIVMYFFSASLIKSDYSDVDINTFESEIRNMWGEPQREHSEMANDGDLILFYNADCFGLAQYVFIFKDERLVQKYIDD